MAETSVPILETPKNDIHIVRKDYGVDFFENIISYMTNDSLVDCTLIVGEERYKRNCHRLILAISSKWFESILKSTPYIPAIIYLPDVTPVQINSLLELIYTGEIETPSEYQLLDIVENLKFLQIRGLVPREEAEINDNWPKIALDYRNAFKHRLRPLHLNSIAIPRPRSRRLIDLAERRSYTQHDLDIAALRVTTRRMTLFNAARYYGVPLKILKNYVRK